MNFTEIVSLYNCNCGRTLSEEEKIQHARDTFVFKPGMGMAINKKESIDIDAPDFLTKDDLAAMFKISGQTALKWLRSEYLDSIQIGKTYYTRKVWLEECIATYKNIGFEL